MATKAQALKVANKFGFQLDESVSGMIGHSSMATFDHPTHSIAGDCRSIHDCDTSMSITWANCIERMKNEGPLLTFCNNSKCEYHNEGVI